MHDALRVVNGVRDLDVYIEQPCLSYEECVSVRRMCPLPFVVDESMDDIGMLTRIIADKSADLINLKISKVRECFCAPAVKLFLLTVSCFLVQVGGLTKARAVRDLAVSAGIAMNIEDTWGGDIVTAGAY